MAIAAKVEIHRQPAATGLDLASQAMASRILKPGIRYRAGERCLLPSSPRQWELLEDEESYYLTLGPGPKPWALICFLKKNQ